MSVGEDKNQANSKGEANRGARQNYWRSSVCKRGRGEEIQFAEAEVNAASISPSMSLHAAE